MDAPLSPDRLRAFLDLLLGSLDDEIDGEGIASRGCLSRYHFDRLISAAIGEAPGAFRRRILLERAAWELRGTNARITGVALRAGYRSAEAFTRAFTHAHGSTPARFRRGCEGFRLSAPNGVHFHPPGGITIPSPHTGGRHMDFVDRIVTHDIAFTNQLLARARDLPEDDLDRPLGPNWGWAPANADGPSLRDILNALVSNKENWAASIEGRTAAEHRATSLVALQQRFDAASKEFAALVRRIRDRGDWDQGFVDALCNPPESFTYGGMLAHVATYSAFRRTMAVFAFRQLGVDDIPLGDPIEWERNLA